MVAAGRAAVTEMPRLVDVDLDLGPDCFGHSQEKVGEDKKDTTETTTGKETINSEVLSVAKKSSSTSLQRLSQAELSALDYSDFDTPGRMLALASVLVKGKMCPLKKMAEVERRNN